MEEKRFQISADSTSATFAVQANEVGLTLTAPEIDGAIAILGDARRRLKPIVPLVLFGFFSRSVAAWWYSDGGPGAGGKETD